MKIRRKDLEIKVLILMAKISSVQDCALFNFLYICISLEFQLRSKKLWWKDVKLQGIYIAINALISECHKKTEFATVE